MACYIGAGLCNYNTYSLAFTHTHTQLWKGQTGLSSCIQVTVSLPLRMRLASNKIKPGDWLITNRKVTCRKRMLWVCTNDECRAFFCTGGWWQKPTSLIYHWPLMGHLDYSLLTPSLSWMLMSAFLSTRDFTVFIKILFIVHWLRGVLWNKE